MPKFIKAAWLPVFGLLPALAQPQKPAGAFATKQYGNLFKEARCPEKAITQKIDAAFQQLFHGDPDSQTVYYPAGQNANGPLAYVTDINNHDVRSEGMSYGMMIAVQMNKKAEFDALWNWAKTYMYQTSPTHPAYGFFSWSMKTEGTPNSESPAPDGEEYWVMSLYFASGRWGNGLGIYNYRAEADQLPDAIKNREVIAGKTNRGPEPMVRSSTRKTKWCGSPRTTCAPTTPIPPIICPHSTNYGPDGVLRRTAHSGPTPPK